MIGVGVVGVGLMGRRHAENVMRVPEAQLVAVADADAALASRVAAELGATTCTVDELVARDDIRAVVVASPRAVHEAHAVAAARSGKDVLVEKPIAATLEPHPARDGCVYVEVRGARGAILRLCSGADQIATAAITGDDWDGSFDLRAGAPYVRAEVVDGNGPMLALSNPIWADRL